MYIESLIIEGYGIFGEETEIKFNKGLNVLIGANNSGKSTVLNALRILLDKDYPKRLDIADFFRVPDISIYRETPPQVTITLNLKEKSTKEERYTDKVVTVAEWLTRVEAPFEAQLTYKFYLPESELESYIADFENYEDPNGFWKKLEMHYLRKYKHELLVGYPELDNKVDYEDLRRFSFQFLDAVRDVERDMFKGSSSLLKEIIQFFIDYELKTDKEVDVKTKSKVKERKNKFDSYSKEIMKIVEERIDYGNKEIFKYAEKIGAHKNKNERIALEGSMSENEVYSVLRLVVRKEAGINLPVTHNGLGFNNLIYISLLLAKMQKDCDINYAGKNASIFSLLAIEEPEAHLHPNMQYRFLKYLSEEQQDQVDQIFITTHSPNITASLDLDNIIAFQQLDENKIHIAYPGKVFETKNDEVEKSKKYVQRFLDVTKSDILFADKIIFVEGITEQMILPRFVNISGKSLDEQYISVINLGGRDYTHFLKLFDENCEYAIRKKVAFITDRDPMRRNIDTNSKEKCPAVLFGIEPARYEYEEISNTTWKNNQKLFNSDREIAQVMGFMQEKTATTLEDAIIYANPTCKHLLVESMSNKDELRTLMDHFDKDLEIIINNLQGKSKFVQEIKKLKSDGLLNPSSDEEEVLKKQIIAHRYLMSVNKGETAQEIAYVLDNLEKDQLQVPKYIKEAIDWILEN